MAFNKSLGVRRLNTLTKKILYGKMLRWIIVVEMFREYMFIVY